MSSFSRIPVLTAPYDDPRPTAFSVEVLDQVIKPRLPKLQQWLQYRAPRLSEEVVTDCARFGLMQGRADAYRATIAIEAETKWPADAQLVLIFHEMSLGIPVALRQAERLWQMRTGMRFPAEPKDLIVWYDVEAQRSFSGEVREVDKSRATAFVEPMAGAVKSGTTRRVMAEHVTANKSRIISTRYLGFQIEAESESA